MRVLYALLCHHADKRADGTTDIHGVFHSLLATRFPASQEHMVFALGIEWDRESVGPKRFQIDLVDTGGAPSLTIQGETQIVARNPQHAPPRTELILPMEDIRFPRPGTYFFELKVGKQKQRIAPLHLLQGP